MLRSEFSGAPPLSFGAPAPKRNVSCSNCLRAPAAQGVAVRSARWVAFALEAAAGRGPRKKLVDVSISAAVVRRVGEGARLARAGRTSAGECQRGCAER